MKRRPKRRKRANPKSFGTLAFLLVCVAILAAFPYTNSNYDILTHPIPQAAKEPAAGLSLVAAMVLKFIERHMA